MLHINELLKSIITELVYVNKGYKSTTIGRPITCDVQTYIDAIFYVLKTGISWDNLIGFPVKGNTVRKKFNEWQKYGIFEQAWIILLNIYAEFKLDFEEIFIDASHIKNMLGTNSVGANVYDRFRKGTKLTILTDDLGVPISIILGQSNKHDITFTLPSLKNAKLNLDSTKFLIGDKGYISKKLTEKIKRKYLMKLITPRKKKRGQLGKIRGRKPKDHHRLKNRFIVEHSFSWFKQYGRLFRRKDKLIKNYKNFVFFGAASIVANKIQKYIMN